MAEGIIVTGKGLFHFEVRMVSVHVRARARSEVSAAAVEGCRRAGGGETHSTCVSTW